MSTTIRIKKSKALNFKKLSFLYLIFIVFYFLSTTGDFVKFFIPLSQTQHEYNERLTKRLVEFSSPFQNEIALKEHALRTLGMIHRLQQEYYAYADNVVFKGDKLLVRNFIKQSLITDEVAEHLHRFLSELIQLYPSSLQKEIALDLGVEPDRIQSAGPFKNRLFYDTPDGAIGSLLEHMESVILFQTLRQLNQEVLEEGLVKVVSSRDSSFLEGFKDVYYVGEEVVFDFFSKDSTAPTIKINAVQLTPKNHGRHFRTHWSPTLEGNYSLVANVGEEYIRRSFRVVKPSLRFLENEQEIAAFIGEELLLIPDLTGMENIRNLNFTSKGAQVVRKGSALTITPLVEGRFSLELRSGNTLLDTRSVFSRKGRSPQVTLKDLAGHNTDLKSAHCLESVAPEWQVINFHLTIVDPQGQKQQFKSQTRFLRNELRQMERSAPSGSTLVFDQIRLVNVNGITTTMGTPIFLTK